MNPHRPVEMWNVLHKSDFIGPFYTWLPSPLQTVKNSWATYYISLGPNPCAEFDCPSSPSPTHPSLHGKLSGFHLWTNPGTRSGSHFIETLHATPKGTVISHRALVCAAACGAQKAHSPERFQRHSRRSHTAEHRRARGTQTAGGPAQQKQPWAGRSAAPAAGRCG